MERPVGRREAALASLSTTSFQYVTLGSCLTFLPCDEHFLTVKLEAGSLERTISRTLSQRGRSVVRRHLRSLGWEASLLRPEITYPESVYTTTGTPAGIFEARRTARSSTVLMLTPSAPILDTLNPVYQKEGFTDLDHPRMGCRETKA